VGASIGLDRLISALGELGNNAAPSTFALCAVANEDAASGGAAQNIAMRLRNAGIAAEVFVEASKKLTNQFIAAEKKGIKFVIIPGAAPLSPLGLRIIEKRETVESLSVEDVVKIVNGAGL
jgi:histidyl-tRNA synthetase